MSYEINPTEYRRLLNSMKNLPKEASQELRKEARHIAETIVKPDIVSAIQSHVAEPYATAIINDTRTRGDRVPTVVIGKKKKILSGGASSNIIRFASIKGSYIARSGRQVKWAEGRVTAGWTKTASDNYLEPAFNAWERAVATITAKFNSGSI